MGLHAKQTHGLAHHNMQVCISIEQTILAYPQFKTFERFRLNMDLKNAPLFCVARLLTALH